MPVHLVILLTTTNAISSIVPTTSTRYPMVAVPSAGFVVVMRSEVFGVAWQGCGWVFGAFALTGARGGDVTGGEGGDGIAWAGAATSTVG
jgi:hypothetical protein